MAKSSIGNLGNLYLKVGSRGIVKQVFPLHMNKKEAAVEELGTELVGLYKVSPTTSDMLTDIISPISAFDTVFWKRKNAALLASSLQSPVELVKKVGTDRAREKSVPRAEWFGYDEIQKRCSRICGLEVLFYRKFYFLQESGVGKSDGKLLPYLKYSYRKYGVRHKKRHEKGSSTGKIQFTSRVEKEYLKPSYSASIGEELEMDFLMFGMIMMFACAFPLAFAFAALNNVTEIRADALKLLAMLKRPVPRAAATIGAWLNIFQ
ncbi:Anoctamin-like protein [Vitis vinifera]|uniref:Anoctamin-like protein n=1 Tax=Vitis vinifera TaxID=29760 RepID=A0A438K7E4_VITVI|nr:Anoctamin-like protein [Vitis vinifera]